MYRILPRAARVFQPPLSYGEWGFTAMGKQGWFQPLATVGGQVTCERLL